MNENGTTPWQGDWQGRLRAKIESLGFSTLGEFLAAYPGEGYVKLANFLGDASIAAMQIYNEQLRAASERGELRAAAKDCLVRFINEYVKRGWGRGRHFAQRLASAYAAWATVVCAHAKCDERVESRLKDVFDRLEALEPPEGWLPETSNDELIEQCFNDAWPV